MTNTAVLKATDVRQIVAAPDGGQLTILDGINLEVTAGTSLAIVGASGSGKTTLLGMLAGLDLPSHGDVDLMGRPLRELDEDARAALRAEHVGFVFQSFHLLPHLDARSNVALPLEMAGHERALPLAETALSRVGLADRMDHKPNALSGGEQQRVAIARAYAGDPTVLFADEPTGNLDAATGRSISDLLFELNASSGTTLVLVTHDSRLAQRCDRSTTMSQGRLTV